MPCLEKSEKEKAAERGKEMTNNEFAEPPTGVGRTEGADDEEARLQEFEPPDTEVAEPAEVTRPTDALTGVPAALLEAKSAIEQQLQQQASQAAGALSVEAFRDAGNVQCARSSRRRRGG